MVELVVNIFTCGNKTEDLDIFKTWLLSFLQDRRAGKNWDHPPVRSQVTDYSSQFWIYQFYKFPFIQECSPSSLLPLPGIILKSIEEGASVFTIKQIYNIHWRNNSSIYFENKGNNSKHRSITNPTRNTGIYFKTRGLILNR